jgi:ribose 5-phosphate isomerase B
MKIAIGCDHLGLPLKEELVKLLEERKIEFKDYGVTSAEKVDYPDIAESVASAVQRGEFDRGILVCGTGSGMAIAANKVPGIRAAVVHDAYSAERTRKSNNAQVMTMGSLIIGSQLARSLAAIWLESEFQGGESARKVQKIDEIEKKFR